MFLSFSPSFATAGAYTLGIFASKALLCAVPGFRQFELPVEGLFALAQVRQDRDAPAQEWRAVLAHDRRGREVAVVDREIRMNRLGDPFQVRSRS